MIKPLTPTGKATFAVVNGAGTLAYAWVTYHVVTEQFSAPAWQYLALLGVSMALGWMTLKLPGINSLISLSDAFVFSAVMFFGPVPAALIAGTEGFIATRKHTGRLLSAFSSLSVLTLSALASGTVYVETFELLGWDPGANPPMKVVLVPLGAMALAHYLLNSWLVATLTALARRTSVWRLWRESYVWTSVSFFAGAAAAGLGYVLVRSAGTFGLLVAVPIIAFTYYSYRVYLGRIEAQNRQIAAMNEVHMQTIEALAMAIDAKGQSAAGHLRRVQAYAVGLAEMLGVDDETIEGIRAASLLHDIGKLAVPDYIINKPGKLTPAELKKAQSYPHFGAEILRNVAFPYPVVPFIRHHRERWDGNGYPDGLAGERIPLGARILSIADCADAMMSARSWRDAHSKEATLAHIKSESGKSFDPALVKRFCNRFEELHALAQAIEQPDTRSMEEISAVLREHAEALYRGGSGSDVLADIGATRREALAMYDLARDLGASLGLTETMKVVMAKLRRLIDFDTGVIYLFDSDSNLILPGFVDGANAEMIKRKTLRRGEGLTGWAVENSRTVVNAKPELDFYGRELTVGRSYASAAVTPLTGASGCLGTITLYDSRPDHFSEEQERILEAVGPQVAAAIESARSYEETRSRAMTDLLTGLPNSRFLYSQLDYELDRARRQEQSLAVVVLDLDRFKPINDTFGHHIGDEVLREVARAIKAQFRSTDTACRWAGDEFVVLMPEVRPELVEEIVRRAQRRIDTLEIPTSTGRSVQVGMSAGWAIFPDDGDDFESLIQAADKKMYEDKSRRHAALGLAADRR